ncbi:MAG: DnaJ domain-containing protein [Myxococcales bacterium]|nr:DnaJ domain-containing protein [Myxococcales bacterium]
MSDEVVQIWVRTEKAQVFGPLAPTSVELLLDNGIITGRVQVSLDGANYVFPGRMPGIRMVFPRALWGEQVLPHTDLDDVWEKVAAPPPLPTAGAGAPTGPASAPAGGPVPRPGAGAMAGPGARAQVATRPMNPTVASAQARAGAPVQARSASAPVMAAPHAGAPMTLEDSLFSDVPHSAPSAIAATPSGVRAVAPASPRPPLSSASIAAAMGVAPMSTPSAVAAPPMSRPSSVAAPFSSPSVAGQAPPISSSPSVAAVTALAEIPATGSLRELSPQRLYFLAAAQDVNGLMTFQLPDRAVSLHFRKGSPDAVDSTHPEDALATYLLKNRLVTPEQLGQAQKEGARFGGELLPALFGLGLVNPSVILEALGKRAGGLVGQVLLATDGHFTFQPLELPAHKAVPAGNRWQLYGEQLRRVSTAELRARLHEALDFPVMKASGTVPVTELRLSAQETRAYAGFDGTRTLNQLFQSQAPEAENALRVAFMLEPCDLVSFAGTVVKTRVPQRSGASVAAHAPVAPAPPRPVVTPQATVPVPPRPVVTPQATVPVPPRPVVPPAAAVPAPPRPVIAPQAAAPGPTNVPGPPAPPTAPAYPAPAVAPSRPIGTAAPGPSKMGAGAPAVSQNVEAEVKRLADVLARMKTQNHFEVLSLTKDSPANAVKVAYFKLAKDYHPDTVPPGSPDSFAKAKADIFARVGDAHRTLSDENLRKEYLAELEAGGGGEKVDVGKFLQADEFFQKGKILMQARKYADAFKMFDDCINIMPDDAEVYAWRGYAKFFTFPDKKLGLVEAMKDITNCLKRNPNIVAAHFHQGMMHRILGDMPTAKKHFNATAKLDPKHIDAQRELRMMK